MKNEYAKYVRQNEMQKKIESSRYSLFVWESKWQFYGTCLLAFLMVFNVLTADSIEEGRMEYISNFVEAIGCSDFELVEKNHYRFYTTYEVSTCLNDTLTFEFDSRKTTANNM